MALEYFTIDEFRALPHMGDASKYPTARVEAVAGRVVAAAESSAGVSFIPRTHVDVKSGSVANDAHGGAVTLVKRRPIAVTAVSQSGVSLTGPELAELRVTRGVLRWFAGGGSTPSACWETGIDNLEITYTAGFADIPDDVKEAVMQATRALMLSGAAASAMDARRTSLTTEAGTINFTTPGEGRPTGYPEVDEVLERYRRTRAPLVMT